jgi:hypothetical protein
LVWLLIYTPKQKLNYGRVGGLPDFLQASFCALLLRQLYQDFRECQMFFLFYFSCWLVIKNLAILTLCMRVIFLTLPHIIMWTIAVVDTHFISFLIFSTLAVARLHRLSTFFIFTAVLFHAFSLSRLVCANYSRMPQNVKNLFANYFCSKDKHQFRL